jgi:hypothetical protein
VVLAQGGVHLRQVAGDGVQLFGGEVGPDLDGPLAEREEEVPRERHALGGVVQVDQAPVGRLAAAAQRAGHCSAGTAD